MFAGIHVLLANQTNTPELMMDLPEAETFMKSAQNVLRHYSVETTQKTLDWVAFGGTLASMYGTRFASYVIRKRMEREAQPRYARPHAGVAPERANGAAHPQANGETVDLHPSVPLGPEDEHFG